MSGIPDVDYDDIEINEEYKEEGEGAGATAAATK